MSRKLLLSLVAAPAAAAALLVGGGVAVAAGHSIDSTPGWAAARCGQAGVATWQVTPAHKRVTHSQHGRDRTTVVTWTPQVRSVTCRTAAAPTSTPPAAPGYPQPQPAAQFRACYSDAPVEDVSAFIGQGLGYSHDCVINDTLVPNRGAAGEPDGEMAVTYGGADLTANWVGDWQDVWQVVGGRWTFVMGWHSVT